MDVRVLQRVLQVSCRKSSSHHLGCMNDGKGNQLQAQMRLQAQGQSGGLGKEPSCFHLTRKAWVKVRVREG